MTAQQRIECDCGGEAPPSVWWRIGGGAFLAMNAMVMGLAVNGSEVTPEERTALELSILFVALAVFLLLAKELFESMWQSLKQRRLGIDLLFVMGIAGCLGASALSLKTGAGGTYADVAAMLLVIFSLGRQVGAYGKARVFQSLGDWAPGKRMVRRLNGQKVPASEIQPGDLYRVMPGEAVPVDGRILTGRAFFQEASVSGESLARSRAEGEQVSAGAFVIDASVDFEAISPGKETSIDQIRELVAAGLSKPGREQRLALSVLRWFAPLVIVVSLGSFWYHSQSGDWHAALFSALSVLVIACPCALGFATPLAVWSAIARLRELGILARSGEAIEKLSEIDTIVFDKTGTLTLPEEYEAKWELSAVWQEREAELRHLLRVAEQASGHPLAKALQSLWEGKAEEPTTSLKQVRILPGKGIEASYEDGRTLFAGSGAGERNLEVKVNGELAARVSLREICESSVGEAVGELESAGLQVMLATGDGETRAQAIPIRTRLVRQSPVDKHSAVEGLQGAGSKVLFVGDGLNDVAAMAWAEASMTLATSAELVRDVSEFVMLHQNWRALPEAIAIARQARRTIRRNIGFSLAYNAVGITLAAMGVLHPVGAALLMTASSLTVILDSMRLMDWEVPGKTRVLETTV